MASSRVKRKSFTMVMVPLMAVFLASAVAMSPGECRAGEPQQKTFGSPVEAVQAMVEAVAAGEDSELLAIFGSDAENIIYSGDEALDQEYREVFLDFYEENSRIDIFGPDRAILYVGEDDWPMPIPIVKEDDRWRFSTEEGVEEIIARRIGQNEYAAIQVCLAYVDSQLEYAEYRATSGLMEYAQSFASSPGGKDGLCWEGDETEPLSPMGPEIVKACKETFEGARRDGEPVPYHGYFYRILKAQGENAAEGAYDYVVDGRMIGGFALVAYPAKYGVSGVMTFIVNHDAIVYEKDLGPDTYAIAEAMAVFDPDDTWDEVE